MITEINRNQLPFVGGATSWGGMTMRQSTVLSAEQRRVLPQYRLMIQHEVRIETLHYGKISGMWLQASRRGFQTTWRATGTARLSSRHTKYLKIQFTSQRKKQLVSMTTIRCLKNLNHRLLWQSYGNTQIRFVHKQICWMFKEMARIITSGT
jgi:hypothetical protein